MSFGLASSAPQTEEFWKLLNTNCECWSAPQDGKIKRVLDFLAKPKAMKDVDLAAKVLLLHSWYHNIAAHCGLP